MLRSLFSSSWKKSPAHLLLLSQFLQPTAPEPFYGKEEWNAALQEPVQRAIQRLVDEKMLIMGSLADLLYVKFTTSQIKEMLLQRHVRVTGRKDELIARLIIVDEKGVKKLTQHELVYICSERGQRTARQFLDQENIRRAEAETQVMKALQGRDFQEACRVVAAFENSQVFPRADYKDLNRYDLELGVSRLGVIFTKTPERLTSLSSEKLEFLRVMAGMMLLWGTDTPDRWLVREVVTGIPLDTVSAIRLLLATGINQTALQEFRKAGIEHVRIHGELDDSMCEECKTLANREFPLDSAPELPHPKCTSKAGCRCSYQPVRSVEIFGKKIEASVDKK